VVRIVLEFFGDASDPRWPRVQEVLQQAGAQSIGTPSGTPPFLVTALVPDGADVDALLQRLTSLDGVGRAEPDALQQTFDPP
jgi:hypothetical protein